MKDRNWLILLSSLGMYAVNRLFFRYRVDLPYIGYFLDCHLNDLLAGVCICAYTNLILCRSRYAQIRLRRLPTILAYTFLCALAWEYVLRPKGVSDPWDVAAYMVGGCVYALADRLSRQKTDRS